MSPNAEDIERACDDLKSLSDFMKKSQMKELTSAMGASTLEKLGSTFPLTEDFRKGYELGLQTCRIVLRGSTALILKGVNPEDVL